LDFKEAFLAQYRYTKTKFPNEIPSFTQIYTNKDELISESFNNVESQLNATSHSEINAIDLALKKMNGKYLMDCRLVTTLEPCLQCAGSIIRVKLPEIYYFLPAKKGEGITSYSMESIYLLNHFPKIELIKNSSIESDFKAFFKEKR